MEAVEMFEKAYGLISTETLLANHPWAEDVEKEMERLNSLQLKSDTKGIGVVNEDKPS